MTPPLVKACLRFAVVLSVFGPVLRGAGVETSESWTGFIDRHCSSCHNDVDREAGLDLTTLAFDPGSPANFQTWVAVHDRVQAGEMPPKEKRPPSTADRASFLRSVGAAVAGFERAEAESHGRATRRRLNRAEYENALRDLLQAPWLQVRDQLPEDGEASHFNKLAAALDVSYVHMARYLQAADYAVREVIKEHLLRRPTTTQRYHARDETFFTETFQPRAVFNSGPPDRLKFPVLEGVAQPAVRAYQEPLTVGDADPARRDLEAVGWVSSNYVLGFYSYWSNFKAPVTGRYRLRFSGYTLWAGPGGHRTTFATRKDRVGVKHPPQWYFPNYDDIRPGRRSEPITIYANGGVANRRLGGFDLAPESTLYALDDVWLLENEFIVTDASRFYRSRPAPGRAGFTNPLAQKDGTPAVAFRWIEVEGPLYDASSGAGYRILFGDLPARQGTGDAVLQTRNARRRVVPVAFEVMPANQPEDIDRLLRSFLQRAYHRPAKEEDVRRFRALIDKRLAAGQGFTEAMIAGFTAILASPGFIFVDEKPGRLDDLALATRLARFLWNGRPDAALLERAARGELQRPEVLRAETRRMLASPLAHRFVEAFLDYWLELRRMEDTTPAVALYGDYYLDDSLTESAVDETRAYFADLLERNLPARHVVDSDFAFLNERLATHYGIAGIKGGTLRRVALPAGSVRGGFMTQASVLKVTANGTTTSPVVRGKWVRERIMGLEVPPPPAAVPAVEPDIRGAVTIRQQLARHRADESCAVCHRKIDPPGFALESFDVFGGWRDRYRATSPEALSAVGIGKNGWPFAFHFAAPVDASGEISDGRTFRDVRDFKRLLLADETQIARNLIRQLSVYATGAPVRFSDREKIEEILAATRPTQFGVRQIVEEVIQSELFRGK